MMIKLKLLLYCSIMSFWSCSQPIEINKDTNSIVAGTSTITGRITTPDTQNKDSIIVTITVIHPIIGETIRHEVLTDQTGKFSLEFDLETETSLIGLCTSIDPYKSLRIKSKNNDSTHIDIAYNANHDFENIVISPEMNKYDMRQSMEVLMKMSDYRPSDPNWVYPRLFDKSIDEFLAYVNNSVSKRTVLFVDNDNLLSKEFKNLITKDFRLFQYTGFVFDYEEEMKRNYSNSTQNWQT